MRRPTKAEKARGFKPIYCVGCFEAGDQKPVAYDLDLQHRDVKNVDPRQLSGQAWDDQVQLLPPGTKKTGRTAANMDRARDLLWSGCLTAEQARVWEWYVVEGLSEAAIAKRLRRSNTWVRDHISVSSRRRAGSRPRVGPRAPG